MLNFRKIDKFYLSGGWGKLTDDIYYDLHMNKIKAVLDLQFLPGDEVYANTVKGYIAAKLSIDYKAILMYDSEFNLDLEGIFSAGQEFLTEMEEKYPTKKDGILIKCAAGISRSPAMLINHLCVSRRMSYLEALNYLRKKEEDQYIEYGSSPNMYFAQYLKNKYK